MLEVIWQPSYHICYTYRMNQFMPQPRPARGEGTNPYSDADSGFEHAPQLDRVELTPEEQAERAEFQRSVNLLNVIGINPDFKKHGVFTDVADGEDLKSVEGKYSIKTEHNPSDLPVDTMFDVEINHPKYHTLQVSLTDARLHAGRNVDDIRDASVFQPIIIMLRGGDAELTFKITSQQNFIIRNIDKLGKVPVEVTDHTERMGKLTELYDIVSDVYAARAANSPEVLRDDSSDRETESE